MRLYVRRDGRGKKAVSDELKKRFAARLKEIIAGREIPNIPGGPSQSYIYRLLKGANPTLDNLEKILRFYGSNLAEFFNQSWRDVERQNQTALAREAEELLQEVIEGSPDHLVSLLPVLRFFARETRRRRKRR